MNDLVEKDRELPANALKKKKDLDHARAMGRDRTRVGRSTDALSLEARGKRRGFSPAATVRPLIFFQFFVFFGF